MKMLLAVSCLVILAAGAERARAADTNAPLSHAVFFELNDAGEAAQRGAALFRDVGCGACHAVRGMEAAGTIGPDLTHLASRPTLAAGTLPMSEAALARWIADPQAVKPGALMPPFAALGEARIHDIAAYLASLR